MTPADRIVLALRRQGWSKSKLGRALGISQASISQLTNGKYTGAHHYPRIAKVLDVPEQWIRTGYPEPKWATAMIVNAPTVYPAEFRREPRNQKTAKGSKALRRHTAATQAIALMRKLRELERERNALIEQVRRLESTAAWQADKLRELHHRRAARPDVKTG